MKETSPMFVAGRLMERALSLKDQRDASLFMLASRLLSDADSILRIADADIREWRDGYGTPDLSYEEDVRTLIREYLDGEYAAEHPADG